jgi:hypothetical protein
MDFNLVLTTLAREFTAAGIDHALIGAFAMAALGVPRATGDLDFLVDGDRSDDVDRVMTKLGYQALHRSADCRCLPARRISIRCWHGSSDEP